jgi:hypothetical protein
MQFGQQHSFYVSAAFNLGAALMESLNSLGLLYFSACYLAIITIWLAKVSYDARFSPDDNLWSGSVAHSRTGYNHTTHSSRFYHEQYKRGWDHGCFLHRTHG